MSTQEGDMTAVFAAKKTLRKTMLSTLRGLTERELEEQSARVTDLLLRQSFYKDAKSVGCYLSMGKGELRTNGIVRDILTRGIPLYTPIIPVSTASSMASSSTTAASSSSSTSIPQNAKETNTRDEALMRMLRLYSVDDMAACPTDKWGILDPGEYSRDIHPTNSTKTLREDALSEETDGIDLILIPGVAFDGECNRLGRGKAYYDRFLASYTAQKPRPLLVALALSSQILQGDEKVPTTSTDFLLDGIISPEGMIWKEGREP